MSDAGRMSIDMAPGLLRQRRNLLVTSLSIIVVHLGDFKFTQLNLLGLVAEIGNPHAVEKALGLLWSYSLIRYWQYYRDANLQLKSFWRETFEFHLRETTGITYLSTSLGGRAQESLIYSGKGKWYLKPCYDNFIPEPRENSINVLQMIKVVTYSASEFIIESSLTTDYLLPFVFAIFAAGFVIFT